MDIATMTGLVALAVLGLTCTVLALWCEYKDGLVGHLCLVSIATMVLYTVADAAENHYEFLPAMVVVYVAMAVFMLRHALRAWRYRDKADKN